MSCGISGDAVRPPPSNAAQPERKRQRRCYRYRLAVGELFEALVNIGIYVLLFGALAWALFRLRPAFGLPAIIGVLVVLAGVRVFSNVGLAGLAVVILGPAMLVMIIGMAMTLGTEKSDRPKSP